MEESDAIHAIVFRPRESSGTNDVLITLHPNRNSAINYFRQEGAVLAKRYHLPVVQHEGRNALGVELVTSGSLHGTLYADNIDGLYKEVAHAVQAGEKCHQTYNNPNKPGSNGLAAAIAAAVAQSTYRYVPCDAPQRPTNVTAHPGLTATRSYVPT